mmetsp:Transcript_27288/g.78648  ORF Transcript_27288/g.78648 Transcript_27288/m.78648 type:complete len:161 (+) Transcript_27288:154-636(+)
MSIYSAGFTPSDPFSIDNLVWFLQSRFFLIVYNNHLTLIDLKSTSNELIYCCFGPNAIAHIIRPRPCFFWNTLQIKVTHIRESVNLLNYCFRIPGYLQLVFGRARTPFGVFRHPRQKFRFVGILRVFQSLVMFRVPVCATASFAIAPQINNAERTSLYGM